MLQKWYRVESVLEDAFTSDERHPATVDAPELARRLLPGRRIDRDKKRMGADANPMSGGGVPRPRDSFLKPMIQLDADDFHQTHQHLLPKSLLVTQISE